MAAVQQTRTRSARLMANLTRSGAQSANTAKEAPHASNTSQANGIPRGPSGLSLFLTNLRLLDLDLRSDWPGITVETFATAVQGQKKRVQCVEWALFHLFAIWDPEETRNKLKPFFPPLDQVQSVNLRAALLRALEQAKKNGALGRDAIVRKTMLDECKGERLEEVLAAFSSAVLKLVVSQENSTGGEHAAAAAQLAIEDRGYKSDNNQLASLVWVHKAALTGVLRDKQADNARFRDFSELLITKERDIARKYEAIQANRQNGGKTMSADVKLEMRRMVRNNWTGNERWMETLISGDAGTKKDGLLAMPFDRVWRRVQQSRLGEQEKQDTGLLEQLDGRVRTQRERLEKWENFHRRLCQERPQGSPSKQKRQPSKKKGIDLGFGAHEALQVGRASPRKPTLSSPKANLNEEYHDLVKGLEDELLSGGPKFSSSLAFLQRPSAHNLERERSTAAPEAEQEVVSEVSELDDEEFSTSPIIQSFQPKFAQTKRQPMLRTKISLSGEWFAANTASVSRSRSSNEPVDDDEPLHETNSGQYLPPGRGHSPDDDGPTPVAGSPERRHDDDGDNQFDDNHYTPRDLSPSPTQELADQILESMEQASPSPVKRQKPRHTLSLAERTRLTMTRGSFTFPDHEEPELPLPIPTISIPSDETTDVDGYEDLSSRTRKSMAGFEKARQKAQLERRRSLRKSKVPPKIETGAFPRLDEENEEDRTLLTEELMAEQDMEAVFRSRPKIKASPLPSPTREWNVDEYM